jgi:hypothetical protein
MSFGATTASRSASNLPGPTPPSVGPGRYEFHLQSSLGGARHGDSALGSSVFVPGVPGAGAALPGPRRGVPGPGAHRPEVYGALGYSVKPPPRVSTMTAVRRVSHSLLPSKRGVLLHTCKQIVTVSSPLSTAFIVVPPFLLFSPAHSLPFSSPLQSGSRCDAGG